MLEIEAGKQGFDHLSARYAVMRKDTPDFKPDPNQMGSWFDDLIAAGHVPDAIDVLKLKAELYPNGALRFQVYTALGDAYVQAGQKDLAIQSYKTQLEKTPFAAAVAEKMKALAQ